MKLHFQASPSLKAETFIAATLKQIYRRYAIIAFTYQIKLHSAIDTFAQ